MPVGLSDTTPMLHCDGFTKKARPCKRSATVVYTDASYNVLKRYCKAHGEGQGIMRMLLPLPWEYKHIFKDGRQVI